MSEIPAARRESMAHRVAHRVAHVAALLLCAGCLVAVAPASPAGAVGDKAERWSGYAIGANGDADGGWMGGYRVGRTPVFVTTPTKDPNRAGFQASRPVEDASGRAASRSETARAAWILSKYGDYRDATQSAAVDATVYHLLVGGRWRIGSARGARRVRQSGDPASVARFARIMLRQSRRSAGAYTAQITTSAADVGGAVSVTLTVLDGHGRPASGLPVTLTMAGAQPLASVTGDDGRAVARFAADARGWQDVTAEVHRVPEHRLLIRPPERQGQATAAEGGARRELVVSTKTAVRGPQTLSLTASPSAATVGAPVQVVGTVSGDGASRTGTASLHGPFASAAAAHCSGAAAATVSRTVTADGDYAWPAVSPSAGGFYVWRVAIDGTETNVPVSGCGATTKVRGRGTVALTAPTSAGLFDVVSAQVTVAGLPFGGPVDVTTTLYGPYGTAAEVTCTGTHRIVTQRRPGNGTFTSVSFPVEQPGWYAWRSSLPEGDLWLGSASACGVVGTTTQVLAQ